MSVTSVSRTLMVLALSLSFSTLWGCSKPTDGRHENGSIPQVSQQALDATREYRDNTMRGARGTSALGDERTQAIDNALRK